MMKILGNRVLVRTPQQPIVPELATEPGVTFKEYGPMKILVMEDKSRKASEWEVVAIGGEGRSGKPDETLAVGQHVIIDNTMGYQAVAYDKIMGTNVDGITFEPRAYRIYSCCDVLGILQNGELES